MTSAHTWRDNANQSKPAVSVDLLTIDDLATELGVCRRTIERWHSERTGPPRIKFGRQVRYRVAAVRQWLEAQEQVEARAGHMTP